MYLFTFGIKDEMSWQRFEDQQLAEKAYRELNMNAFDYRRLEKCETLFEESVYEKKVKEIFPKSGCFPTYNRKGYEIWSGVSQEFCELFGSGETPAEAWYNAYETAKTYSQEKQN